MQVALASRVGHCFENHLHQIFKDKKIRFSEQVITENNAKPDFVFPDLERVSIEQIKSYIIKRLKTIFPGVSANPLTLRNPQNNSTLFLLCFAVSNPSSSAIDLSLRAVDHILTHTQ